jgi:hypothetical protein
LCMSCGTCTRSNGLYLLQSADDRSGSSGSSKDQHDRKTDGDATTDLTDAILLSKVRPWPASILIV